MNKPDITVDIRGSNHVLATHLHIQSAVNRLDIKTIKKGNQMELPIWVRRTDVAEAEPHWTAISTYYF